MKSRTLMFVTAMTFFAALAIPAQLAAQGHPRYKLVDIGTFGGPVSYFPFDGEGIQVLNNHGTVVGLADTPTPDPNAPDSCLNPDCFLTHAFRWQDGVLTDLGTLPGVNNSILVNNITINARGWIAGDSQNGVIDPLTGIPEIRAVLWKDGQIIDLGTLGGNDSGAVYVNNGGQVVGSSTINASPEAPRHPFLWENGVMRDLGTLGGPTAGPSNRCSNERHGLVVGTSDVSSTPDPSTGLLPTEPFLWENGTMHSLGTLGGTFGFAECANNRGQVIGQSSPAENPAACFEDQTPGCHAFLWEHGVMQDLGTLGGDNATAVWLNDAGEIVGAAELPGNEVQHAFLWRNGSMTDLGTLGSTSRAKAINSNGQVVGTSRLLDRTEPPFRHAFLWERGGRMIDLNTLIPANSSLELVEANSINDRGEIVGIGVPDHCFQDFCGHVYLLIPCGANDTQSCDT